MLWAGWMHEHIFPWKLYFLVPVFDITPPSRNNLSIYIHRFVARKQLGLYNKVNLMVCWDRYRGVCWTNFVNILIFWWSINLNVYWTRQMNGCLDIKHVIIWGLQLHSCRSFYLLNNIYSYESWLPAILPSWANVVSLLRIF